MGTPMKKKKQQKPIERMHDESEPNSFGEYLRRERELRDITLPEISANTKISQRYLQALEQDDDAHLPAAVFIKGFIRNYAIFIGLDPDEALLRYQEQKKTLEAAHESEPAEVYPVAPPKKTSPKLLWGMILAGMLLGGAALYWYLAQQTGISPFERLISRFTTAPPPAVEVVAPESSPPERLAASMSTEEEPLRETGESLPDPEVVKEEVQAQPVETEETPFEPSVEPVLVTPLDVVILAVEQTWLAVDVDGIETHDVTLQPGERLRLEVIDSIRLHLGNAAGIRIRVGGKTLGPFGRSGRVRRDLLLTRSELAGEDGDGAFR
jgi:cytoskeleton protein RodZ